MASSSSSMPMSLVDEVSSTGARMLSRTPLWRHASSSASRDRLALEVLREDVVVRLGRRLQQLVPAERHLVDEVVGDRHLVAGAVLVEPRTAVDDVHVALERVGLADGHLERRDLAAELGAQGVHRGHRVGVLAIAPGDHEEGRASQRAALCDRVLGARPDGRAERPW